MTAQASWIDVSLPISADLPTWPGAERMQLEWRLRLEKGDVANDSALRMGTHTGTHVDAPSHFVAGGSHVDAMPLDVLIGPAIIVEMPGAGQIDAGFLDRCRLPGGASRLLFRTRNSNEWLQPTHEFKRDFAAVTADGAEWLVKRGIRLVGVDYLSVEPFGQDGTTHRTLLGAGVVVIEGLDLSAASAGEWDLVCLPLRLRGAEGAPCRVVIRRRETRG